MISIQLVRCYAMVYSSVLELSHRIQKKKTNKDTCCVYLIFSLGGNIRTPERCVQHLFGKYKIDWLAKLSRIYIYFFQITIPPSVFLPSFGIIYICFRIFIVRSTRYTLKFASLDHLIGQYISEYMIHLPRPSAFWQAFF